MVASDITLQGSQGSSIHRLILTLIVRPFTCVKSIWTTPQYCKRWFEVETNLNPLPTSQSNHHRSVTLIMAFKIVGLTPRQSILGTNPIAVALIRLQILYIVFTGNVYSRLENSRKKAVSCCLIHHSIMWWLVIISMKPTSTPAQC